jgi:iron(III) transport system ATP-binding protein
MDGGRIAQQGSPQALYRQPATRFLADFIGDANLVDGTLQRQGDACLFTAAGVSLQVGNPAASSGPVTLALRPHRLRVVPAETAALVGTCKRADYLGSHTEVLLDTPWGELLVFGEADASEPPTAGSRVGLAFDPRDAIVLAK